MQDAKQTFIARQLTEVMCKKDASFILSVPKTLCEKFLNIFLNFLNIFL